MKTYILRVTRKIESEYKDNPLIAPALLDSLNRICERFSGRPLVKPPSYDISDETAGLRTVYLVKEAVVTNVVDTSSRIESTKITYIGDKEPAELIKAFKSFYGDEAQSSSEMKVRNIRAE